MVVKVKDITIRADREGITGEWGAEGGRHSVFLVKPNTTVISTHPSPPPAGEVLLPYSEGFHIPSDQLEDFSYVELVILYIDSQGQCDNISIHLDHIDTGIYSAPRHTKIPR